MGAWGEAVVFGAALVAFVLGLSSIILGVLPQPAGEAKGMKEKIEYGFFGITGLVFCILLWLALTW